MQLLWSEEDVVYLVEVISNIKIKFHNMLSCGGDQNLDPTLVSHCIESSRTSVVLFLHEKLGRILQESSWPNIIRLPTTRFTEPDETTYFLPQNVSFFIRTASTLVFKCIKVVKFRKPSGQCASDLSGRVSSFWGVNACYSRGILAQRRSPQPTFEPRTLWDGRWCFSTFFFSFTSKLVCLNESLCCLGHFFATQNTAAAVYSILQSKKSIEEEKLIFMHASFSSCGIRNGKGVRNDLRGNTQFTREDN